MVLRPRGGMTRELVVERRPWEPYWRRAQAEIPLRNNRVLRQHKTIVTWLALPYLHRYAGMLAVPNSKTLNFDVNAFCESR